MILTIKSVLSILWLEAWKRIRSIIYAKQDGKNSLIQYLAVFGMWSPLDYQQLIKMILYCHLYKARSKRYLHITCRYSLQLFHFCFALWADRLFHIGVITAFRACAGHKIAFTGNRCWIISSVVNPVRFFQFFFVFHNNLINHIILYVRQHIQSWLYHLFGE